MVEVRKLHHNRRPRWPPRLHRPRGAKFHHVLGHYLYQLLAEQTHCVVAMEACATSHHWGRVAQSHGHEARLIPAAYVKPFVKRQKNDRADAEAIAEAASRPSMRIVAVNTGLAVSYLTDAPLVFATQNVLNGLDKFALLAIPGFILAGNIMEKGGITEDIIRIFRHALGHTPGSLGLVTIFSCMFFAAISGSGPGTVAAIGSIMIPALIKYGYPPQYAAGVSAIGGMLGVMIPPSNPLIICGMLPGLFTALLLGLWPIFRRGGPVP
nr:TRAP transporter large permease subunit [Halovulum marinum]